MKIKILTCCFYSPAYIKSKVHVQKKQTNKQYTNPFLFRERSRTKKMSAKKKKYYESKMLSKYMNLISYQIKYYAFKKDIF